MFERILVPLDGSPRAEQALPLATHIAHINHSSIFLLRSVEFMSIYSMQTVGMMERIQQLEEQGARNYLNSLKTSELLKQLPTMIEVYVGDASSAILEVITRQSIDLVVLCSYGYTGLKQWVLGSVAQKIARTCPVPVLIQRDEQHPLPCGVDREGQPIFRVCIALDGSSQAEAIIEPALSIAAACAPSRQAEIHLLRIIEPLNQTDEDAFKEIYQIDLKELIHQQAQIYLQDVVKRLEQTTKSYAGIKIIGCLRSSADIAQEIIQYVENGNSDQSPSCQLLALTTHGHTKLDRWIFGSIAERVLNRTRLPLLIVRPPQQEMLAQARPA
ncbi:universal stress protein [Dictyobacter arantiisoli]|uniref:Universal stress protein UspA n=1 Tax=Dictyobacter arantiisoli TaxID=2014874 RepID=A0A5A5TB77_9CHLR|nr:universal stress protein [Dictyobacter arantiisoli]GCF08682.1 universal stress protein UspA [Dictyobacter arantiisoli]